MGHSPGIVWGGGNNPSNYAAAFSGRVPTISDGELVDLVNELMEEAVAEVEKLIKTRGVKGGVPNGSGRVDSAAMLKSVTFRTFVAKSGRIGGEFGYLINAPKWALWQEYGTYGGQGNGQGILAMLALTDAYARFKVKMEAAFMALGSGSTRNNVGGFYDARASTPYRKS